MSDEEHLLEEIHGHIAVIRINRPKVLNALNLELMEQMAELFEGYDADDDVRVILLAGGERAWAAGADIGETNTFSGTTIAQARSRPCCRTTRAATATHDFSVPGFAAGRLQHGARGVRAQQDRRRAGGRCGQRGL